MIDIAANDQVIPALWRMQSSGCSRITCTNCIGGKLHRIGIYRSEVAFHCQAAFRVARSIVG